MKRSIYGVFLALILCSMARADVSDPTQVLPLINAYRIANGMTPFTSSSQLDSAALRHSTDMASNNFFNHVGSDSTRAGDRMTAAGYVWSAWGENIAAGYPSARSVVDGWMASAGHRANILNPGFQQMGIAVVYRAGTQYGYYWTQVFGTPRGVPTPHPPPNPPPPTPVPPPPVPTPVPLPLPISVLPQIGNVVPRMGQSGLTVLTLTGVNFGDVRGASQVTIRKSNTQIYASVTYLSWSATSITLTFQTVERGYHFVQLVRGDGRKSLSPLFYVW